MPRKTKSKVSALTASAPGYKIHRERYAFAEELLLNGVPEHEVIDQLMKKWPILRSATTTRTTVINKVLEGWAQESKGKGREERRDLYRAKMEYGWRRALSAGEYGAAANFQKAIAKLDDLNNEGRVLDITFAGVNLNDRSALEGRLKELAGRAPALVEALKLPDSVKAVLTGAAAADTVPTYGSIDAAGAAGASGAVAAVRDEPAGDVHPDGLKDLH